MNRSRPHIMVPLSKLVASRRNVRRVKPERDAHHRMVASIRAHGLIAPLVIRPGEDEDHFQVVAGARRLAALKEIHKKTDPEPNIPCVMRAVDDAEADALSLSENFTREPMHPLDEAEAFATLAGDEGKYAGTIASDFGVTPAYVRQRMKLATLDDGIKAAYRANEIDTGIAEAFSSVPQDRQLEIWKEVNGHPQHADHVRNIIAHNWIDSVHALFDVASLPDAVVSRDLFNERVLVERRAFMEAQAAALEARCHSLKEEGWANVVVGPQADVQDYLYAMDQPEPEYDPATTERLEKLNRRRQQWEGKLEALDEADEARAEAIQEKLDGLDGEVEQVLTDAVVTYGEATKASGTAFLILDPDGRVRTEYRMPRRRATSSDIVSSDGRAGSEPVVAPTSDDLHDDQRAIAFAHEAIAVRAALLQDSKAWKRVLVLALHDKVRKAAIAIGADTNATNLLADTGETFASTLLQELRQKLKAIDPLAEKLSADETEAYDTLKTLSERQLDEFIGVLTVECLTSHPQHRAGLMRQLATELEVNVRTHWRPDAHWLGRYQKHQLSHLLEELRGPAHRPDLDKRKKSELVDTLAALFTEAAEGKLEPATVATRINAWMPSALRD